MSQLQGRVLAANSSCSCPASTPDINQRWWAWHTILAWMTSHATCPSPPPLIFSFTWRSLSERCICCMCPCQHQHVSHTHIHSFAPPAPSPSTLVLPASRAGTGQLWAQGQHQHRCSHNPQLPNPSLFLTLSPHSPSLTHVQELVKRVLGVLSCQHQQPPVTLLLKGSHL